MRTSAAIAKDNDLFRTTLLLSPRHKIVLTERVKHLKEVEQRGDNCLFSRLISGVRNYDPKAFTTDDDPYGEHDFGTVTVGETKYFWKIDYYDLNFKYGLDPHEEVTALVLTLMAAEEY